MRAAPTTLIALLALALLRSAAAATYTVDISDDLPDLTPQDGLCLTSNGHCSVRAAIQQANATPGYDTVQVPEGNYPLLLDSGAGEDQGATGDLDIREPMALIGLPIPGSTLGVQLTNHVLTFGAQFDRVLDIDTGSVATPVRIEHVLLNFGSAHDAAGGGGLLVRAGSAATLRDVSFYANFSNTRGTALAVYGQATLRDSLCFDNHPFAPAPGDNVIGTFYVGGHGSLDLEYVSIWSNTTEVGGGIAAVDDATVTVRRGSIHGNGADNRGGGSVIDGYGGGVYLAGRAAANMENVVIFQNSGFHGDDFLSGVLVREDAQLTLRHASIQDWPLAVLGGGSATVHLADSLLYTRSGLGQVCSGSLVSDGGNWLASTQRCPLSLDATDHLVAALPATETDFRASVAGSGFLAQGMPLTLLVPADSSALDQAAAATCPSVDLLGSPRPTRSRSDRPRGCDAGAIELPLDHLLIDGFEN